MGKSTRHRRRWPRCLSAPPCTGNIHAPFFPVPVLGAACSLGQVLYAGAAPGVVAGAVQVNVRIAGDAHPRRPRPHHGLHRKLPSGFLGDTTVALR